MDWRQCNAKHFQNHFDQEKNEERIMHCVLKLQRNNFSLKIKEAGLYHFST